MSGSLGTLVVLGVSTEAWIGVIIGVVAFFGVALWALVTTLRQEDRKVDIVDRQDRIETFSPRALDDLRAWIEKNPDDPLYDEAVERYNECVETLQEVDETFYDWSESQIQDLEKI